MISQMPRCPDLVILVTTTDRQKLNALPLAHEYGVVNYMTCIIGDELGLHYGGFWNRGKPIIGGSAVNVHNILYIANYEGMSFIEFPLYMWYVP